MQHPLRLKNLWEQIKFTTTLTFCYLDHRMNRRNHVTVIYDYECPACDYYCQMLRIRDSIGEIQLIDARVSSKFLDEITARGLDIDQGMVVIVDDNWYYGADAIHAISLMSSRSGLFNRINYRVFRSRWLSRLLYPILRYFRRVLLRILGKTKINNLRIPGNDRF